ncbi:MAG: LacI family DNA-binding transcriptional regulator [Anaerostipes sp.]|nr:LacI family DNA-binding transcriptional regulator [Anaerostipes sp.]
MANYKKITMKDIAEKTGVSISAVSMILNKRHDVSFTEETIKKVFHVANELGYKFKTKEKDDTIRKFHQSRSAKNIVAVFCPNIYNPYYSMIAQSIEAAAYKNNYKTIIMTTFRDKNHEKEMIQDVIDMNVKGIIFTMMPNNFDYVEKIAKTFPIVMIGDKASSSNLDVIETNNYTAGVLLAEHLYELGHRHIAFLTTTINPDISLAMRYQRLQGIENIFKKNSMNENYSVILREQKISPEYERNNLSLEYEVGYNLCQECLENRNLDNITAFIGNNDMVAYGIIDAILKNGYSIPKDFSVCSFDNDFPSRFLPISLTSIEHYMEEKGKKSFETLLQKIQWDESSDENSRYIIRIEYKPTLIIRDSTNKARNK